jgi:hypothetical protein
LVGKKENENSPAKSPPNKNSQSEIEKLRAEISELEKGSPKLNNNSEKQKELAKKRKKLNELERSNITPSKPDSNLAIYLSLGGITLLIGLIFLVRLARKKKPK